MPEYTPTTEQVRTEFIESVIDAPTPRLHAAAAFDRWLAVHDAEVALETLLQAADAEMSVNGPTFAVERLLARAEPFRALVGHGTPEPTGKEVSDA